MTTSEQIRVLCVRSGVSLSELARRINQTPQNFSVKLKRNTVTQDELRKTNNITNADLCNKFADEIYLPKIVLKKADIPLSLRSQFIDLR